MFPNQLAWEGFTFIHSFECRLKGSFSALEDMTPRRGGLRVENGYEAQSSELKAPVIPSKAPALVYELKPAWVDGYGASWRGRPCLRELWVFAL